MAPTGTQHFPAGGRPSGARPLGAPSFVAARFALWFVALFVICWSALPELLQTVPHADNVEQLNWAHALQWGYLKHPPLPTALLWTASAAVGPSALLTYFLAMACVGASLLIIWRCALVLGGPGASNMALTALLLTSADYYLMGRGSFLNHNTVMLPFVAASAWAVLQIVRDAPGQPAWRPWLLLGLVQALGLLTKYQMAIIIAANAAALLACGPWRQPGRAGAFAGHVLLCAVATALPLLPHFFWLQQHAFSSFTYAEHNLLADLPILQRIGHTLGFLVQQVGRLAPAAVALGLALLLQRRQMQDAASAPGGPTAIPMVAAVERKLARALLYLACVPLGIVVGLALVGGVAPQNHWGASATLLLPLLLATRLPAARALRPVAALAGVLTVQVVAVIWNVVVAFQAPGFHHRFPAPALAALAQDYWRQHEPGPLRVVVGPDWDAGAIALFLPGHPAVLASGNRGQAPWVTDDELEHCGALIFWRPEQTAQDQVGAAIAARIEYPVTLQSPARYGGVSTIAAGILAPTAPGCGGTAP